MPFICVPLLVIDCGQPPEVLHAVLVGNATLSTYGSSVTYQCDVGYSSNATDNETISWCQDSGNWSLVATCQRTSTCV